jgi:hypothetical protein
MGLGKTIQTVALLAHLACEEGVWGPHLVVVPTRWVLFCTWGRRCKLGLESIGALKMLGPEKSAPVSLILGFLTLLLPAV